MDIVSKNLDSNKINSIDIINVGERMRMIGYFVA